MSADPADPMETHWDPIWQSDDDEPADPADQMEPADPADPTWQSWNDKMWMRMLQVLVPDPMFQSDDDKWKQLRQVLAARLNVPEEQIVDVAVVSPGAGPNASEGQNVEVAAAGPA